jgi:POT family proton-dependent oligopeptide transporter
MAEPKYSTTPVRTTGFPPGIPFIIGNEAAERFCYYGMSTILVVFMTDYLKGSNGALSGMTATHAKETYHLFIFAAYFMPLLGAIISDALWGKYRTIIVFSLVYCLGNLVLALNDTRLGLTAGLALIALGSGGIKPCVAANVGDQFGATNQALIPKAFGWFYFSVNFGSFFSTLLTPWLLDRYGPRVAFGVPGGLMFLATAIFWLGRYRFVHVPPAGKALVKETFGLDALKLVARLIPIYLLAAVFFSLWYQTGSAWVLQAKAMNLHWLGIEWLPSQVQAINPVLILVFIPLFSYLIYPAVDNFFLLTPLRKMAIGLFLTVPTFLIPAWIEMQIGRGLKPSIGWQFLDYLILSAAEVMVSIPCQEFSYSQAPKKLKSLIMSLYYLAIALGNAIAAAINFLIQNPDGTAKLGGASYFLFFAGLMFFTAVVFIFVALTYRERSFEVDLAQSP